MEAPIYAVLPPRAASASVARELVVCACNDWGHDCFIDDLSLVVTELVANAVRHAGTEMEVRLINLEDGIRLEVQDGSTRPLRPRPSTLVDEGGRGLMLVDALASRYGVEGDADGKRVWVEMLDHPVLAAT
ncbi:MAG: response regulator receiver [Frankiales bacterium]|nr:response regulator receiver [Frankiales bacterium]